MIFANAEISIAIIAGRSASVHWSSAVLGRAFWVFRVGKTWGMPGMVNIQQAIEHGHRNS